MTVQSTRIFSYTDQQNFATLSGDYNPLHIDKLAARRMMFGSIVVHGVHLLLWSLDTVLPQLGERRGIRSLSAMFNKPVRPDEPVQLSCERNADTLDINLIVAGATATRIKVSLCEEIDFEKFIEPAAPTQVNTEPAALTQEQLPDHSGHLSLFLDSSLVSSLFPALLEHIPGAQVAALLSTTRLVGMQCPGLHSIFSRLQLELKSMKPEPEPEPEPEISYRVSNFDKRFGMTKITLSGPYCAGEIEAFLRPPPQEQASYKTLSGLVDHKRFGGQRALVIGGSRGLGEVCVKLLAAGGADVQFSYHQGKSDADQIVEDITAYSGSVKAFQYDVVGNPADFSGAELRNWTPSHLYFFATPFIFAGIKGQFSSELYEKFNRYYITGFWRAMETLVPQGVSHVLCPSTVAVEEKPAGLAEYAAAKIASEMVCDYLSSKYKGLSIYKPRLPRLATDQTATNMPVHNEDPVQLMLEHLQAFCKELS